ncbi:MAG: DUF2147 domain-containing protein [Bacteroidales bacterium]|jgi:uncharacterized protein (DUF2147 family)|nr:DUF2147 domain-containing protein [Bacteroidales bacterium]
MKNTYVLMLILLSLSLTGFSQIDKILGKWKTIDEKDGSEQSIIYIYKATNGKYYGKIEKLFKYSDKLCTECQGANKDKPILGMIIINEMELKDNELRNGTILDPNNGKVYNCNISYDAKTKSLKVKGFLDKAGWLGKTKTWFRAE